jgi:hypothetical protein
MTTNKGSDTMKIEKTVKGYPYGLGLGLGFSIAATTGVVVGSATVSLIIGSVVVIAVIGYKKHRMKKKTKCCIGHYRPLAG